MPPQAWCSLEGRREGVEEIMLRNTFAVVVAGMALVCTPIQAQDTGGPSDSARYTFHRVQDNFLRLDVETGQVSQCGWAVSVLPGGA
jgi:hypothetical protein